VIVPSLWVNTDGKRFAAEAMLPKQNMPIILRQPGGTFWAIFGREALGSVYVSGSDWGDYHKVEEFIVNNPAVVKRASTLSELASKIGVPAEALQSAVARYNKAIEEGVDAEFKRFGAGNGKIPQKVQGPPYCALQYFPLSRKSLGGIAVDIDCHVLDADHHIIPGLYAVGEVSGFGGINGKHGLEGTFLAPSLAMGRVAGRAVLAELSRVTALPPNGRPTVRFAEPILGAEQNTACLTCHTLPVLVNAKRSGFWHFEKVHAVVLEKQFACASCHAEVNATPAVQPELHKIDPRQQLLTCGICHKGERQ
jgi:hypothetical protein